jgi:hypothetical protein
MMYSLHSARRGRYATVSRLYKDGDQWRGSTSFDRDYLRAV